MHGSIVQVCVLSHVCKFDFIFMFKFVYRYCVVPINKIIIVLQINLFKL